MSVQEIEVDLIHSSPFNPRLAFTNLEELAESMKNDIGIINPITVRPLPGVEGHYELVAGERRLRAARIAGKTSIMVIIKNLSDDDAMRMQLVENIQREDLSPSEEGKLFKKMQEQFGYSTTTIAEMISKSRPYVSDRIRILGLPEEVVTAVTITHGIEETKPTTMTYSKARVLTRIDEKKQKILIEKIQDKGMTHAQIVNAVRKADEIETIISKIRRPELREKLLKKYNGRMLDDDVKVVGIQREIDLELGKPIGPTFIQKWRDLVSKVRDTQRPFLDNSFVREWKSEDRHFIQLTVWMDEGDDILNLKREDHPIEEFIDFLEADKYAELHGGYCSGILTLRGKKYWCIYVKTED